MVLNVLKLIHVGNFKSMQPIDTHERSTGVVSQTVFMNESVSFQTVTTSAGTAGNFLLEV
jgi:hypothetical protein